LSQGAATSGSSLSQSAIGPGQVLSQGTMGPAPTLPAGSQPALPSGPGARPPEPHRHHDHREHHEPHRHHDHREHHEPHQAARVIKAAGGSSVKTVMIVVTAVVVVAAGGIGAAIHFLSSSPGASSSSGVSSPQPLISITSKYMVGNTPAGASGTTLHISGQQFSGNSAITFLLDGHVAPGNAGTHSDANGNFSTDVTITAAWSVGTHTLTARDGSNHSTKKSVSVTIVQPGQANTPGPNGAPPDDTTFTLTFTENATNTPSFTRNEVMLIKGHPDPAGGSACLDRDDGQQHSLSRSFSNNTPYTETDTFSCQGSYKGGKISYSETLLTSVITYTNGSGVSVTCTLLSPQPHQEVTGSYAGNGTFTGTFAFDYTPASDYSCSDGSSFSFVYTYGTWTGTVSGLQR